MAKSKASKVELGHELAEKFSKAKGALIAEYSGMKAEDLAALRRDLRKVGCEFKVIKNRVARKAIEGSVPDAAPIKDKLVGPIGIVYFYSDIAEGAKTVIKCSKEKAEQFKLTSGLLKGRLMPVKEFEAIAELPSKDVLLARIIGSLVAPHRRLLGALNGVAGNLVRTVSAIKEKKSD